MTDLFPGNLSVQIQNFAVAFIPAFLGIILHEIGHGWVAFRRGDPTAKLMGRLTLNPLPHIDIMGLVVFIVTALTSSFVFGWAKPVPINVRQLRNPRRDMMLVSLAGPCTNLLLALIFGVLLKLTLVFFPLEEWYRASTYIFALKTMQAGIIINLGLAFLNLLPVPPLDGSKVLSYFLPPRAVGPYLSLERWGFVILLALAAFNLLSFVLGPLIRGSYDIILTLFDIL